MSYTCRLEAKAAHGILPPYCPPSAIGFVHCAGTPFPPLTAKNSGGNAIDTRTGSFTTDGATALENVSGTIGTSVRKVMENGVMYLLLPDGTHYDAHGIRVK